MFYHGHVSRDTPGMISTRCLESATSRNHVFCLKNRCFPYMEMPLRRDHIDMRSRRGGQRPPHLLSHSAIKANLTRTVRISTRIAWIWTILGCADSHWSCDQSALLRIACSHAITWYTNTLVEDDALCSSDLQMLLCTRWGQTECAATCPYGPWRCVTAPVWSAFFVEVLEAIYCLFT